MNFGTELGDEEAQSLLKKPAVYDHCVKVYNALLAEAQQVSMPSGQTRMVYTGFVTRLFEKLGFQTAYYPQIKNALVGMGCIDQIKRGGGTAPSVWVLIHPPTEEDLKLIRAQASTATAAGKRNNAMMQRISDLTNLVHKHEHQLATLQAQIDELEKNAELRGSATLSQVSNAGAGN